MNWQQLKKISALILSAGLGPYSVAGEVYKCVENGKTTFSSVPTDKPGCQAISVQTEFTSPERPTTYDSAVTPGRYPKKGNGHHHSSRVSDLPDSEAEQRKQSVELGKAVARAPIPSLNSGAAKGRSSRNGDN